ncbi:MAG: hypothetical protein M1442_03500 [Candidatus Thermoplasmatota archaeon]|jgi:hypothetical protein|nr:hypothetical protein [Candidatus Thermoplasmatota archaeon]
MRLLHNTPIKNIDPHCETSYLPELIPHADLSDRRVGGMLIGMGDSSKAK